MGLDISLIKICDYKTSEYFVWDEFGGSKEIIDNYKDCINIADFEYEGKIEKVKILYFEEISYQRKGVKKSFYDNFSADDFLISKIDFLKLKEEILPNFIETFNKNFTNKFKEGENLISISY